MKTEAEKLARKRQLKFEANKRYRDRMKLLKAQNELNSTKKASRSRMVKVAHLSKVKKINLSKKQKPQRGATKLSRIIRQSPSVGRKRARAESTRISPKKDKDNKSPPRKMQRTSSPVKHKASSPVKKNSPLKTRKGREVTPVPREKTVRKKKAAKVSPMKTRLLQKRTEKEQNIKTIRCCLCRSTEGKLFACSECNARYHLDKCMKYPSDVIKKLENGERKRWLCARCVSCAACGEFISDPTNVECNGCALAYHGRCSGSKGEMIGEVFYCCSCVRSVRVAESKDKETAGKESTIKEKKDWRRGRRPKEDTERRSQWEEEARKIIEERNELYDAMMDNVTGGRKSGPNSPRKMGDARVNSRSPEKTVKIALQADKDLFEAAKAALALEEKTKKKPSDMHSLSSPSTSTGTTFHPWIYVGSRRDKMKALYSTPYPPDILKSPNIFICPYCLRPNREVNNFQIHQRECTWRCPPGNEIYRDNEKKISFFEIDGSEQKAYCRRVCLLGKLFISSKTLVDEVDTFVFYVLTEHTKDGCEFVGYFSKEKNPSKNNNLSCLLTLPNCMRSGYGRLLIDLSYQLSRIERKIGSPEHPLSDLGLLAYKGFWRSSILCYLRSLRGVQSTSVKEMSLATRIAPSDVMNQLLRDGLLVYRDGVYFVNTERRAYRMPLTVTRRKTIDQSKLVWKPSVDVSDLDPGKLNYYI